MESGGVEDLIQKAWKIGDDLLESFVMSYPPPRAGYTFGWTEGGGRRGSVSIVQLTLTSFDFGVVAPRP